MISCRLAELPLIFPRLIWGITGSLRIISRSNWRIQFHPFHSSNRRRRSLLARGNITGKVFLVSLKVRSHNPLSRWSFIDSTRTSKPAAAIYSSFHAKSYWVCCFKLSSQVVNNYFSLRFLIIPFPSDQRLFEWLENPHWWLDYRIRLHAATNFGQRAWYCQRQRCFERFA